MSDFKDHFSKQSALYAKFRPHYPPELFSYLASLVPVHDLVWDCGTGNGQAAVGLAEHFNKIYATDPSEKQIANCFPHPKVIYKVEKAEQPSLADSSVDLITVANALHWFDLDKFYKESNRLLKPGGIIAVWTYAIAHISKDIDQLVEYLHNNILGSYWLQENRLVMQGYKTIPFPFKKLEPPAFSSKKLLDRDELIGYLNTWSATQTYISKNDKDPIDLILSELKIVWPNAKEKKEMTWDLVLMVGN